MSVKRKKAVDSRGRPVDGLYTNMAGDRFTAGYRCPVSGRWTMKSLPSKDLSAARRDREALLSGLREGRLTARSGLTFNDTFADWQASRSVAERTLRHEAHLRDRHLKGIADRRLQDVTASDVAAALKMPTYSDWTRVAVHRLVKTVFAHAVLRGVLTKSPVDGLRPDEKPKQRNAQKIARLSPGQVETLIDRAATQRWKAAFALAAYAGLRMGEVRALRWGDIGPETVNVRHSAEPDGTIKSPKTAAGVRSIPILPDLRRVLTAWRLASPRSLDENFVVGTSTGRTVSETAMRKALNAATKEIEVEGRLSMHSLRHSFASTLIVSGLAPTTVALLAGHTDAGFTLRVYAADARPMAEVVEDVLARTATVGLGS